MKHTSIKKEDSRNKQWRYFLLFCYFARIFCVVTTKTLLLRTSTSYFDYFASEFLLQNTSCKVANHLLKFPIQTPIDIPFSGCIIGENKISHYSCDHTYQHMCHHNQQLSFFDGDQKNLAITFPHPLEHSPIWFL